MLKPGWPVMLNGAVNAAERIMRSTSRPSTSPERTPWAASAVVAVVGVEQEVDLREGVGRGEEQLVAATHRGTEVVRPEVRHPLDRHAGEEVELVLAAGRVSGSTRPCSAR